MVTKDGIEPPTHRFGYLQAHIIYTFLFSQIPDAVMQAKTLRPLAGLHCEFDHAVKFVLRFDGRSAFRHYADMHRPDRQNVAHLRAFYRNFLSDILCLGRIGKVFNAVMNEFLQRRRETPVDEADAVEMTLFQAGFAPDGRKMLIVVEN